jgi:nucleotide-binding universal stress UspA family protein
MPELVKNILIPTDFSDYSKKSFEQALVIASETNASVTLLHCIEPPYDFASTVESTLEQMKRGANRRLNDMFQKLMKDERFKNIQGTTMLATGLTKATVMEIVKSRDIDLIVMGSMGVSALRKRLFGSTSTDIALRSPVPVIIVPESDINKGFDHILFATDYRPNDLETLKYLIQIAELFDSTIHIVHVSSQESFNSNLSFRGFRELVKEELSYSKLIFDIYFDDEPFIGLSRYIENNDIDMLVMTRYKKSIMKTLFEKNQTKEMGYYSRIPIMVVPG